MDSKTNQVQLPSVAALSYLGDARHALFVRRMLIERGFCKSADLNREALKFVTAEAQARMYEKIQDLLLSEEKDVFRRAFNSTHLNKPRHASGKDYRLATGYEAIIGMLTWQGNEERLEFLLQKSHNEDIEK